MNNIEQLIESEIARALDGLFLEMPAAPLSRERVQHVLGQLAHRVAIDASHQALLSLMTTDDMAAKLGVSARRVRALAKSRGVGWQVSRGTWIFIPSDEEAMRPRRP